MPPRVSVLTVCRNDAPNLPGCLAGVAHQDWPELEHVVQDGDSTDGSLALLREHARHVDLRLVSLPDAGIHDAFVRGLRRTTGDIVAFSWADESLLPGAVRRAVDVLEARPDLGGLFGAVIETDEAGRAQRTRTWPEWSLDEVFHYRLIPPVCAAFFRRKALEEAFLPIAEAAGDCFEWLLWITVGARACIQRIDEPLSLYAQRPGQLSRQPEVVDGYPARLVRVIDTLLERKLFAPSLAERTGAVKAGVHLWAVEWLIREHDDLPAARRHFDAAIAYDPPALRGSVIPWAVGQELLARGDARWVADAFERAAEAGAGIAGSCVLRALAHAQLGEGNATAALEGELGRLDEAPVLAHAIARVLERLRSLGRTVEADRTRALLAALATRTPAWQLAYVEILAALGSIREALELSANPFPQAAPEKERLALRRRVELLACSKHAAVRAAIGELAGRGSPISEQEAAVMARELAEILATRPRQTPDSPGLVSIAAIVQEGALSLGLEALARELRRWTDGLVPHPGEPPAVDERSEVA